MTADPNRSRGDVSPLAEVIEEIRWNAKIAEWALAPILSDALVYLERLAEIEPVQYRGGSPMTENRSRVRGLSRFEDWSEAAEYIDALETFAMWVAGMALDEDVRRKITLEQLVEAAQGALDVR